MSAAASASDRERSSVLGKLIRDAREQAISEALPKARRGVPLAEKLSALTDDAVTALYEAGSRVYPEEAKFLAVAAIGGYGRGKLAPYSDIDLLFLHTPRAEQKIKPLLDFILYALWDAGLAVSQFVYSPAMALDFAKEDHAGCTSFIDTRPLAGNERLTSEFITRFDKYRERTINEFVTQKLEERSARLVEDRASRYAVEPDIKEGKGGLRDVQTIYWLSRYAYGVRNVDDQVEAGVLTEEEAVQFRKAIEFFWSLRVHLHDIKGRADECLTFDVQPEIAERLGYHRRGKMEPAERLMKHYFLHAREVGRLIGVLSTSLEEAEFKTSRLFDSGIFNFRAKRGTTEKIRAIRQDEIGPADPFVLKGDRMNFVDPEGLEERPLDMFRLFRFAGRKPACEIHPDALQAVATAARHVSRKSMKTPEMALVFKQILLDTEEPVRVLRDMSEAGLLGQYLPAFGMLIGRMKRGLYRRYTLDEHVLKSLEILVKIRRGEAASDHPISSQIMQGTSDVLPFYLAVFMHETERAYPAQERGRVARRINSSIAHILKDADARAHVVWAVMNHRLMSRTSARRNVMDPQTVRRFAEEVQTQERLDLMLVLTICHLRVAGINSWDKWTRRDISVLYQATRAWLKGGEPALAEFMLRRRAVLRNKTARHLPDWSVTQLDNFFGRMASEFFEGVNPSSAARFAQLVREVDQSSIPGRAVVNPLADGMAEVMVYSRDKPGLFADIAGVIAMSGCAVRAATAFPVKALSKGPDMAANIFVFQGEEGVQTPEGPQISEAVQVLTERFNAAIAQTGPKSLNMVPRIGDRRHSFVRKSSVTLDEETSADCLIVETRGRDRPGLLYKLASALRDIGVSIRTAYIATFGELAVDAFYIQDMPGYKITDKRRQEVIRRALMKVLEED